MQVSQLSYRVGHSLRGGDVALVLVEMNRATHRNNLVAVLHGAMQCVASGEVELTNTRLRCNAKNVLFVHTTACQQTDTSISLLVKLLQQGNTCAPEVRMR